MLAPTSGGKVASEARGVKVDRSMPWQLANHPAGLAQDAWYHLQRWCRGVDLMATPCHGAGLAAILHPACAVAGVVRSNESLPSAVLRHFPPSASPVTTVDFAGAGLRLADGQGGKIGRAPRSRRAGSEQARHYARSRWLTVGPDIGLAARTALEAELLGLGRVGEVHHQSASGTARDDIGLLALPARGDLGARPIFRLVVGGKPPAADEIGGIHVGWRRGGDRRGRGRRSLSRSLARTGGEREGQAPPARRGRHGQDQVPSPA